MKNFRIMALVLALMMVVSLVACGGGAVETDAPDAKETEAPAVNETEAPTVKETEAPAVNETEAPAVNETEAPVVADEAVVIEAFDGCYVRGGDHAGATMYSDYGDYLEIKGNVEGGFDATNSYDRAAFLKFDLADLEGNAVESAILNLTFKEYIDDRAYVITLVDANWIGADVTATTMPEKKDVKLEGLFAEGAEAADITTLVNAAIAAGEEVLAIMIESPKEMMGENGSQTMIDFGTTTFPYISCK